MNLHEITQAHPEKVEEFLRGWWYHFKTQYRLKFHVADDSIEYMHNTETTWTLMNTGGVNVYRDDARHQPTLPPEAWAIIEILP